MYTEVVIAVKFDSAWARNSRNYREGKSQPITVCPLRAAYYGDNPYGARLGQSYSTRSAVTCSC
jgi:hypothetical protein